MGELQELQAVMAPLMNKISQAIPQPQYPGMGMGGGDMGGMPALSPQQLQQIQALQEQDPAAFEQMMRMMQG